MNTELYVSSPQFSYPNVVKWIETDNATEQVKALPPVSKKPPLGGPEGLPALVAASQTPHEAMNEVLNAKSPARPYRNAQAGGFSRLLSTQIELGV
jgi:hypothetical protein